MNLVEALKSIGEHTRLRVLALLAHGELSVGELVDVLGISQPRLSRHMKFLTAAGLVERLPEGAWVFYRLPAKGHARDLIDAVLPFVPETSPEFKRDLDHLRGVKQARSKAAEDYFNALADNWDDVRGRHYPADAVEDGLLKAAGAGPFPFMVDLGTGTGRMMTLFHERVDRAEGIDLSHKMLNLARTNLERAGAQNASVRFGDVTALPFDDGVADLITLHQVLHYLDRPERVIDEAARILAPNGRLLIVDFAPHQQEFLRTEYEHRHLGLSDEEVRTWTEASGLSLKPPVRFDPADDHGLSVSIWTADKRPVAGEKAA